MLRDLMRLFSRQEKSSETAQRRLRMVLVMDRIGLGSDHITAMKDEMVQVVSRYLVVEQDAIELEIHRSAGTVMLVSNIPVKDIARPQPVNSQPEVYLQVDAEMSGVSPGQVQA